MVVIKEVVRNDHHQCDVGCRHKACDDLLRLSSEITLVNAVELTPIPAISEFGCSSPHDVQFAGRQVAISFKKGGGVLRCRRLGEPYTSSS